MSMTPIEAAAREIESEYCQGNRHDVAPELVAIITRHLFPVVKAEDVDSTRQYYVMGHRGWFICDGRSIGPEDEIRGPVPFPE